MTTRTEEINNFLAFAKTSLIDAEEYDLDGDRQTANDLRRESIAWSLLAIANQLSMRP